MLEGCDNYMNLTGLEKAQYVKHALICCATGDSYDIADYNLYRKYLLSKSIYVPYIPVILKRYLDGRQIFKYYQEKEM